MRRIEKITHDIAKQIMHERGWAAEERLRDSIEWDLNRDDSQYSMVLEETEQVIEKFLSSVENMDDDASWDDWIEDEEEEEEEPLIKIDLGFDEYGHPVRDKTNTTSASVFIFMDAGTGNARYVSDVREWLKRVDRLGVPDTTEVEGTLHLCYDIDEPYTERIECGGCGKKDVLLTVHSCEETPC